MIDYARAAAYLRARGVLVTADLLALAFEEPAAPPDTKSPLTFAELDWRAHVSEQDRQPGSGLDVIFHAAGWGHVPAGVDDKVPDWCGMAVVAWFLRAGLNPAFNTSFLHCLNVEAFFTYGSRKNVNPNRLDTEVLLGAEWTPIGAWHRRDGKPRRWLGFGAATNPLAIDDVLERDLFAPGDVLLIDWSGRRTEADHVAMVRAWDGQVLSTFEGNRTGLGPGGEKWHDAVVAQSYDLADPKALALIYGVGRCSPLDFTTQQVR